MLSKQDYESLKKSVRGWDRSRLARYGVQWPPMQGWRKALLREYEACQVDVASFGPKDALEILLGREKKLTAYWYDRMSGAAPWADGERAILSETMDKLEIEIDHMIGLTELTT